MDFLPKAFSGIIAIIGFSVGAGNAAIVTITNPVRVTGADAIDPTGAREVGSNNPANSTSQSVIEGLSGFGAIQDFTGFTGNASKNDEYIFDNVSDVTLPDLRLTYTGDITTGSGAVMSVNNSSFSTSANYSLRLPGTGAGVYGMSIQLGSWNGAALTTGVDLGVAAFGFTLTGRYGQVNSVTFTYYDALNNLLSTQVAPATNATGTGTAAVYTGYQILPGQNAISRVEISVSPISTTSNGLFALDDIGFTPMVPEPSALLLAAGALPLWMRRKRKVS